jgi:DNA-binding PadR family transcriptional regulator
MTAKRKKESEDQPLKPVRLSAIDEDILTLLTGRELYGLEILDQLNLDRPTNQLRFGSLYPALGRLEKKGLASWRWGDKVDEFGGARRKYYKVTGLGATSLNAVQRYRARLATGSASIQPVG